LRLLLDTHVLLWWLADDRTLGQQARAAIAKPESEVAVSAASIWELSIKKALGKLIAPADLEAQIAAHRFSPLAITVLHALTAGSLPDHHRDPFDRMLVAQAQIEDMTLVTRDELLSNYGVATIPA
jgi:PIN domain nuclease of toxin-antitoxin system